MMRERNATNATNYNQTMVRRMPFADSGEFTGALKLEGASTRHIDFDVLIWDLQDGKIF
jgi:hypothetical protein